ncbi:protein vav, putative [Pediculus humanus corporis]|uniref:Protein vav, putative n=1 Tax=Pediculus humanus subsp. corporis TaxID=121224 RepID=E0VV62_PEDHC|nr:protein vav, putative [Pediculus humanus corporis]EEB17268.1 protein vav, putative [Pediculus humanus corporis]
MCARIEPWRECADWLTRCGILRSDHIANGAEAKARDLAVTLRDGVILCNLLNDIEPGCIDTKDVSQKPRLSQVFRVTTFFFLQTSHDTFGLKESDLFDPVVLFDLTDFVKVLQTLSKLSLSPKFKKKNISGFSLIKHRSSHDELYKDLIHSNVLRAEDAEYSSHHVNMRNEEIYHDLCSINRISLQQIPSALPASLEKRDYVINELIETERNYLDVLGGLQRSFMRPLASIIREEDFKIIFAHIKELYEIHGVFLTQLRKAASPHGKIRLSEVFLSFREKFLIYGDYIANLTNAQNLIQDLCGRSEMINNEVENCQQEANNGKFKLRDILSVPMQRILKYHLLLDKLVSETQMNHEDYRGLERAKEAMVDVAQYINEVKRDSDALAILAYIEQSISDWHMPPDFTLKDYGRLILDGELRIKAHNDQKQKVRYVFVFDRVMVMCKALKTILGDQYCYRESLRLDEYKIQDIEKKILTRDARWSYQWYLVHRAELTAYTCYSRTEEFKKKFMNAISEALDNIEPSVCRNTEHNFKMFTFESPTTCSHCSKFLKGKIYQGYQCEKCHINCHKICIPYCGRCGSTKVPQLPPPRLHFNELKDCLWFVGEMGRKTATSLLENEMDGTYLLRIRPQRPTNPSETIYAISLKTNEKVKHMKVYEENVEGTLSYYLSLSRFFKSIIELITYYQHVSLEENFVGLDVKLQWPFSKNLTFTNEMDFSTAESNRLLPRADCRV